MKKQQILLCGGPDRCGKTNILKELSSRTGYPYFKAKGEHKNFLCGQYNFIYELKYADPRVVDLLKQTGYNLLIDRAYMCEFVYSKFFGRKTDLNMLRFVDEQYAKLGAKILICTRNSFKGIKDNLNPKLDEYALMEISNLYYDFVNWTQCKSYILYVDDENIEREIHEILNFING
jgi:hypothetical protein